MPPLYEALGALLDLVAHNALLLVISIQIWIHKTQLLYRPPFLYLKALLINSQTFAWILFFSCSYSSTVMQMSCPNTCWFGDRRHVHRQGFKRHCLNQRHPYNHYGYYRFSSIYTQKSISISSVPFNSTTKCFFFLYNRLNYTHLIHGKMLIRESLTAKIQPYGIKYNLQIR